MSVADEAVKRDATRRTDNAPARWSLVAALLLLFPISLISMLVPLIGIGMALAGIGLGAFGWWRALRRSEGGRVRASTGVVLSVAVSVFLWPAWRDAIGHDLTLRKLRSSFCAEKASRIRVASCEGSIYNPSNGNQCAYEVVVVLETGRSTEAVRELYARRNLSPEFSGDPYYLSDFEVVQVSSGDARTATEARMTIVDPEPGADFRCN
jgi:hypothetical protein